MHQALQTNKNNNKRRMIAVRIIVIKLWILVGGLLWSLPVVAANLTGKIDLTTVHHNKQLSISHKEHMLLNQLDKELDQMPLRKTEGIMEARRRFPDLSAHAKLNMLFLRASDSNAKMAAKKLSTYWTNRLELFSEEDVFDDLVVTTQLPKNHSLGYGHMRTHPKNEQVLILDLSKVPKKGYDLQSVVRDTVRVMMMALKQSPRMQQEGIIFVIDTQNLRHFDGRLTKSLAKYTGSHALPVRTAGYCVANMPPSFSWIMTKFIKPLLGEEQQRAFQITTNPDELRECIGFGSLY